MWQEQVYNGVKNAAPSHKKLHRQIVNLNTMASPKQTRPNPTSSIRMRRTELSNQRFNQSREQSNHRVSGMTSNQPNESYRLGGKSMSSILSLSRRKLPKRPSDNTGGKQIVENLYMLSGDDKQRGAKKQQRPHLRNSKSNKQLTQQQSPRGQPQRPIVKEGERRYQSPRTAVGGTRGSVLRRREKGASGQRSLSKIRVDKESLRKLEQKYQSKRRPEVTKERDIIEPERREGGYRDPYGTRSYETSERKRFERQAREQEQWWRKQESRRRQKQRQVQGKNDMNIYYFAERSSDTRTQPQQSITNSLEGSTPPRKSYASDKQKRWPQEEKPSKGVKLDGPRKAKVIIEEPAWQKEESRMSERWRENGMCLEERREEDWRGTHKVISDETADIVLPVGSSTFLPVESKREEEDEEADEVMEKVILHFETLNIIADYTKQFQKMYDNVQPWQVLIFLSYKKFYVQRTKAISWLRANQVLKGELGEGSQLLGQDHPFILPYSRLTPQQLSDFRQTKQCLAMLYQLEAQNTKIRNALRSLYNLYIEKSGSHVNMLMCDDFSQEILSQMGEEVQAISQNLQDPDLVKPTKLRIGKIIKSGLLIAYLNGSYIRNFSQLLLHQDTVMIGKKEKLREDCICDLFMGQFKALV